MAFVALKCIFEPDTENLIGDIETYEDTVYIDLKCITAFTRSDDLKNTIIFTTGAKFFTVKMSIYEFTKFMNENTITEAAFPLIYQN
jgi:hypothetical protein